MVRCGRFEHRRLRGDVATLRLRGGEAQRSEKESLGMDFRESVSCFCGEDQAGPLGFRLNGRNGLAPNFIPWQTFLKAGPVQWLPGLLWSWRAGDMLPRGQMVPEEHGPKKL